MRGERRCDICGERIGPHEPAVPICRSQTCRFASARQALEVGDRARLTAREAALTWFSERGFPVTGAAPDPVCVVPYNSRRLVPSDPARVALFRQSLVAAVDAAQAESGDDISPDAAELDDDPPGLGAACGACGGQCCEQGDTHAFLRASYVAPKLRQRPPESSAMDFVESYLARLPARSYEGSCVFHAEAGCALPRSARSQVCDRYRCHGLNHVAAALDIGRPAEIHVAAIRDASVRRTVSISGRETDLPPKIGNDDFSTDAEPDAAVRAGLPPAPGRD